MDELIGLIAFILVGIFGAIARYREVQRAKRDALPTPPKPRAELPEKTRRQFERREVRTARPATVSREPRPKTAPAVPRPPQPRPAPPRPKPQPHPVLTEEEKPRLRPEQVRAQHKPVLREQVEVTPVQMRAGRQAARNALQQAIEHETDTSFDTPAAARLRHVMALPPLFRSMDGIRAGIVFSEIFSPPLALR